MFDRAPFNDFLARFRDLGFGFLFPGRFPHISKALGLFLIFAFSAKILQFCWQRKGFIRSTSRKKTSIVDPKHEVEDTKETEEEEKEEERDSEVEELDAKTLRKMLKSERRRREKAVAELEKERMAAASAAEEVMAMILRLQREKSAIEMQANQDRRMAEQRQEHDNQVIRYLERMAMDCEQRDIGFADDEAKGVESD